MAPEAWAFAGVLVTNFFGLFTLIMQGRKQTGRMQELHTKVDPVSNGFASHVTEALQRIERRLDDHMRGHP